MFLSKFRIVSKLSNVNGEFCAARRGAENPMKKTHTAFEAIVRDSRLLLLPACI
jgi:hypothetical protein